MAVSRYSVIFCAFLREEKMATGRAKCRAGVADDKQVGCAASQLCLDPEKQDRSSCHCQSSSCRDSAEVAMNRISRGFFLRRASVLVLRTNHGRQSWKHVVWKHRHRWRSEWRCGRSSLCSDTRRLPLQKQVRQEGRQEKEGVPVPNCRPVVQRRMPVWHPHQ